MRFQTPQFIEVQDKIFGPFTLRQFIYLAGGAGLSFMIYRFVPISFIALLLILPVVALSLALTFYKVHGRPFVDVLESAFTFSLNSRLYIWKKVAKKKTTSAKNTSTAKEDAEALVPKLSDSKLKELSWSLDVNDVNNASQT